MTTTRPKFTILIPTRERSDTLRSTLRTCVQQTYENLEIVVSDNASADDTRAVVASFDDPRIRYINTGRRVSMSANWDFGLRHVEEGFVTVVGDDDGLVPGAVADAAALIAQVGTSVLTWKKARYHWPSWPEALSQNYLFVPVENRLIRCDAKQVARDCARLWLPYAQGPCIYNSFVDAAVLQRLRKRCGDPVLYSNIPDCYSTFAIASEIDSYWYATYPFTVNGGSSHSNGGNTEAFLEEGSGAMAKFVSEIDVPPHPRLPRQFMGSIVALVIGAALHANDRCWSGTLPIDVPAVIPKVLREVAAGTPVRYAETLRELEEAAAERPELREPLRKAMRRYPNRHVEPSPPSLGIDRNNELAVRTDRFGVFDVEQACDFTRNLVGPYQRPARSGEYSRHFKYIRRGMQWLEPLVQRNIW
jgi:glycosyl transferase family 2